MGIARLGWRRRGLVSVKPPWKEGEVGLEGVGVDWCIRGRVARRWRRMKKMARKMRARMARIPKAMPM
jgi:transposase InsO family protein